MFRLSNFDKALESATSHLHLEPEWPSILLICDLIRQKDVTPKKAFQAIKSKMQSQNPHSAYYALLVLESVVKNCGSPMHEEVFSRENCEMFNNFVEETQHENVRQKMLELIQCWAYAFRNSEKYQSVKDAMTILKTKGHTFPELKETDAMFSADTAPKWTDGKVCNRCRVEFSLTQRKHHCRNCGQIFCSQCSSKQCTLPKFGIEKNVRVCDGCYISLQKSAIKRPNSSTNSSVDSDLPAEYLNSTLAQQSQQPPRKTDQELKEEEELQLALALSQSEAEQKKSTYKPYQPTQTKRSPSPVEGIVPEVNTQLEEPVTDPDLAKYLNRMYWEQKKANSLNTAIAPSSLEPASPSAPSPMPQSIMIQNLNNKIPAEDSEIDDFSANMKSQVEIFVNRMKSNSSRGRNISNDTSVQTLFMNLTSLHSQLLFYIKQMDDKRMWYEQLQDKLTQIKDSRAALDVLRAEHIEKMRRAAEEQEHQRQLQMAQKLEIMRKKKQEYLQYQRQLALQRIQEQEREMQMRQEQQKAQYRMGQQTPFPFLSTGPQQGSPSHQMPGVMYQMGYNSLPPTSVTQNQMQAMPPYSQPISHSVMPNNGGMFMPGSIGLPPSSVVSNDMGIHSGVQPTNMALQQQYITNSGVQNSQHMVGLPQTPAGITGHPHANIQSNPQSEQLQAIIQQSHSHQTQQQHLQQASAHLQQVQQPHLQQGQSPHLQQGQSPHLQQAHLMQQQQQQMQQQPQQQMQQQPQQQMLQQQQMMPQNQTISNDIKSSTPSRIENCAPVVESQPEDQLKEVVTAELISFD